LSVPGVLGANPNVDPALPAYLSADPARVAVWSQRLAALSGFKVAISWQGNKDFPGDRTRSASLARFAPLAELPGVRLLSIQRGAGADQVAELRGQFEVNAFSDLDARGGAFIDTAAVMKSVDLVITTDTAVAHLAGALGVPVWVALGTPSDWRWLRDRSDCPWYPTMRLFRQPRPGDWEGLFRHITDELAARVRPGGRAVVTANPGEEYERGIKAFGRGDYATAESAFRSVLRRDPTRRGARHNLGVTLAKRGRPEEAITELREYLRECPDSADGRNNLGLALLDAGRPAEAEQEFRESIRLTPARSEVLNNLGVSLTRQDRLVEAADRFRAALRLRPEYPEAIQNLANALRRLGETDLAIPLYRRALELKSDLPGCRNNLALALKTCGEYAAAIEELSKAAAADPRDADVRNNLGVTLADADRVPEAVRCLEEVVSLRPEDHESRRNLALVRLLAGDYQRGWVDYEARLRCAGVNSQSRSPRWEGDDLRGRSILLYTEQGFGDTLQFVRYAPLVKARGGRVVVECSPDLVPVLRSCPGIDEFVGPNTNGTRTDLSVPLLSLPFLFRTTLATIPAAVPYLTPEADRVARWRWHLRNVGGIRVGIAWRGSPTNGGDPIRSAPLSAFRPLAEVPGVQLISLQQTDGVEELSGAAFHVAPLDLGRQIDRPGERFTDSAAVMACLDLVVTVDTALAHLAGAIGIPVWIALPFACDWRWLRGRSDNPWYPSARLFRQPRPGAWDEVFSAIAVAVNDRATRAAGPRVEVSAGELLDKITILTLKAERISDPEKVRNIRAELATTEQCWQATYPAQEALSGLRADLLAVNTRLWDVEDEIRECERRGDFGSRFIELARAVYHQNDHRAALKRQVNQCVGSRLVEEKSYRPYQPG
jgi:Flp pilus assembly protein TadD